MVENETTLDDGPLVWSIPVPYVLHIEFNRPNARNAIDDELARALGDRLRAFDTDPELRVAVLSGRGPGFSAGLDLKAFLRGETGMDPESGFAGITGRPPRKPVIAGIEGFALAGGLEIALACDLIVAASDARLGIPEVQRGLVADGGALLHLPRRVPYQVAMEMALTGEPIEPDRARAVGLVSRVVPGGQAVQSAIQLASVIAANAPLAVAASKHILAAGRDWKLDEAWGLQERAAGPVWQSADAQEGANAFAERRAPQFRGV